MSRASDFLKAFSAKQNTPVRQGFLELDLIFDSALDLSGASSIIRDMNFPFQTDLQKKLISIAKISKVVAQRIIKSLKKVGIRVKKSILHERKDSESDSYHQLVETGDVCKN